MIHPTALVHAAAKLGDGVSIGAYTIVGENVEIGDGTTIGHHCVITGRTRIGRDNRVFHFCSLGEVPQDKKYDGEPTALYIGDRNTIREFCMFNVGTSQDSGVTSVGDDNWIMAYAHLAHDCQVGSNTIMANSAQLAGHVHVGDYAILGGFTGVHQFVRVGAHSFTAGHSYLQQDLPPYVMAAGNPAVPRAINSEGLTRRGFSANAVAAIKRAFKTLYRSGVTLEEARTQIAAAATDDPELQILVEFLAVPGRGIVR